MKKRHMFYGQTLLITVLVLTIALTVALALIRRTTTDVKTTAQLEESARAFSVAEAGIEDALKKSAGNTGTIESGNGSATFISTYDPIAGTSDSFTYPTSTEKGDVATVWLVPHNADNSLNETGVAHYCETPGACAIDICWEQPTTPTIPAVEIAVLYKTTLGVYGIERFAYDPDEVARPGNNFTLADAVTDACGKTGVYTVSVTLPTASARPLALRLRPYYNATVFTVSPPLLSGRTIPSQGFEVSSTGKTDSGVTRKIVVKKRYDAPASIFDFVLFSNTTIMNQAYQQP